MEKVNQLSASKLELLKLQRQSVQLDLDNKKREMEIKEEKHTKELQLLQAELKIKGLEKKIKLATLKGIQLDNLKNKKLNKINIRK